MDSTTRALWLGAWLVVAAFVVGGAVFVVNSRVEDPPPVVALAAEGDRRVVAAELRVGAPQPRTLEPYRGYGTWVDVFDYDPAYRSPTVGAGDVAEMAELGVGTLYLQAARLDERTPDGLVDPWLLADFVLRAHDHDIAVVAWYLPFWDTEGQDLERLVALHEFAVLGERFDGIGVDIEWIGADPDGVDIDADTRSARLLALSAALDDVVGDDPLAAIVPPPVQMEVVNTMFWPGFPWAELAESYDVWMPMSYWSFRSDASGYGEGYTYHEESVRRLRANVGDPDALVHGIGGIGGLDGVDDPPDPPEPLATIDEIERFVTALDDTGSIGGSIYDWNTLEPAVRERLAELLG